MPPQTVGVCLRPLGLAAIIVVGFQVVVVIIAIVAVVAVVAVVVVVVVVVVVLLLLLPFCVIVVARCRCRLCCFRRRRNRC